MTNIFRNIWLVLDKKEKKLFVTHVLLSIFISLADILALAGLLWLVQLYIRPDSNNITSFFPAWIIDRHSLFPATFFLLLFCIKNIGGYLATRANHLYTGKVAVRLSYNNLAKYQQTDFIDFVNTDSSSFIRKIAFQPFEFCQYILSGLQQIITQVLLIGFSILAILVFNAKIFFLLLIILLPAVVGIFYWVKKRMAVAKRNVQSSNEKSYQYLLDALKGYVEANVYQRNNFFLRRFVRQREKFSYYLFDSISLQNLPARVIEIVAVFGLFMLIVINKWTDNDNSNMLITIGAFMAAAYKIIPGIVKVVNLSGQIRAYEFSADELISANPSQIDSVQSIGSMIESLEARNIRFKYSEQQQILNNLSIKVKRGDMLGISSLSGKGKTTLLNILLGFLKPDSGEILINGRPADQNMIKAHWLHIAYVRQQSFFIYDTVLRNIILDEGNPDRDRLSFALKVTGLDKLLETFPEGLEKIITENGKNISGGQQQRIALARALYKNADLIFLDEPFNELDKASAESILNQLQILTIEGKIIIIISHDKQNLSYCNKIISLDE